MKLLYGLPSSNRFVKLCRTWDNKQLLISCGGLVLPRNQAHAQMRGIFSTFLCHPLAPCESITVFCRWSNTQACTQRCLLSLFHHLMRHYETKSLFNTAAVTIFPAHLTATNLYKTLLFVPCPCSPQNCEGHFERSTVRLGRFLKRPCYRAT